MSNERRKPLTDIEIDDLVDEWHRSPDGQELHDYLGWTEEEYSAWVEDPQKVPGRK
jgi:hypothetical protein